MWAPGWVSVWGRAALRYHSLHTDCPASLWMRTGASVNCHLDQPLSRPVLSVVRIRRKRTLKLFLFQPPESDDKTETRKKLVVKGYKSSLWVILMIPVTVWGASLLSFVKFLSECSFWSALLLLFCCFFPIIAFPWVTSDHSVTL